MDELEPDMNYVALFDLDGTLVDTEARSRAAWTTLFEAHGVPVSERLLATFCGRRGPEVLAEHQHLFPGRLVPDLYAEVVAYFSSATQSDVPVPGAVRLVRSLYAKGVPMAVVSSSRRQDVESALREFGMYDMMTSIVTADDVEKGKPDPEGYLRACRQLGVSSWQAVVFEDAPVGVAAAKAVGARCVGITTTHSAAELRDADVIVADLTRINWPPVDRNGSIR